jgi:FkbM family methyltransferase
MQEYRANKLRTALDIVRRIENWPTALALRLRRHRPGLRLLAFRNGLNVVCRRDTRDWDVIHELLFAGGYDRALQALSLLPGEPVVLDLGSNIGLFSLRAAAAHPRAQVHAFEPGPPNYRLFEINRLANPSLADRVHLHREAVAGEERTTEWRFDDRNPGASGLYGQGGATFPVRVRAFADVLAALPGQVALAKIDIEGAEYELLNFTPAALWKRVDAISLELHSDPAARQSQEAVLQQFLNLGYQAEQEKVCSYYLHRQPAGLPR